MDEDREIADFRVPLLQTAEEGLHKGYIVRVRLEQHSLGSPRTRTERMAHKVEDDVGLHREVMDLVELLVRPDDRLHAELGLEDLRLVGIADERGDVEGARAGVAEKFREDSAADVPWSQTR